MADHCRALGGQIFARHCGHSDLILVRRTLEKTVAGRVENLRPWKPGESGNPGGRPKTKPLTEELARLLEQKAPNGKGETWAVVVAQALLLKARTQANKTCGHKHLNGSERTVNAR